MSHSRDVRNHLKHKIFKQHGRKKGLPVFRQAVADIVKARKGSPVPTAEYIDAMTPLAGAPIA